MKIYIYGKVFCFGCKVGYVNVVDEDFDDVVYVVCVVVVYFD